METIPAHLLTDRMKNRLKELSGVTDDVDLEGFRTSKWGVKLDLVKGLMIFASFKVNARTGIISRAL